MSGENQDSGQPPLVSAVIPCLNEEKSIGICVEKAINAFKEMGIVGEVVIGDNGSTDRSVQIAESLGARVVHQPLRGYGAALMAAIGAARADFIIMGDADDSYDWSNIAPFVEKLKEGNGLVMGNRFAGGILPGAMPPLHRYFGNPLFSFMARVISDAPIGDFYCGMRAFTRETYERLRLRSLGMEFAIEMVVNSARTGVKIDEIPIKLYPDKRGRPPHLRTFRDGWRTLRFIMTYAPNYLYIVPGVLFFLIGAGLQAALISGPIRPFGFYMGIHFLALGCLLSLVGFNIVNLGILAKVIVSSQSPYFDMRFVKWLLSYFSLEIGLIVGTLLAFAGLATDVAILSWWISRDPGPMEESIHLAFVATSSIAIGVNMIFSSFLLNMFMTEERVPGNE